MLNSLDIKNYRNLKHLRVNSLGRVNLFTGRNNTGKSTILEAVAIYATSADLGFIYQLLSERGENFKSITDSTKNSLDSTIKSISSLFTDRLVGFEKEDAISIGSVENTLFGIETSIENSLSIRFVKYIEDVLRDEQNSVVSRRRILIDMEQEQLQSNYKVGLETRIGSKSYISPIEDERSSYQIGSRAFDKDNTVQYIRTRNIDRDINGKLWDKITLTEKEQYVIEALKIIEPSTERIAFIEENSRIRTPVIKLANSLSVFPLRSMGDGINRVLTIILALVNSDNGYLLIDEFENGLHYSVQSQLWNIIFNLAKILNVQVFVTTHSEDCIYGFENVLNSSIESGGGMLIRLENEDGKIKQVEFRPDELKIATNLNIETR